MIVFAMAPNKVDLSFSRSEAKVTGTCTDRKMPSVTTASTICTMVSPVMISSACGGRYSTAVGLLCRLSPPVTAPDRKRCAVLLPSSSLWSSPWSSPCGATYALYGRVAL